MKKNLLNKLAPVQVYEGTKEAELANGLMIVSDCIFDKYEGNAFTNKKLADYVKEKAPEEIEMVGVDGGVCCTDCNWSGISLSKCAFLMTVTAGVVLVALLVILCIIENIEVLQRRSDAGFETVKDYTCREVEAADASGRNVWG